MESELQKAPAPRPNGAVTLVPTTPCDAGRAVVRADLEGDAFALMGYFKTTAEIFRACEAFRDAGYTHFDAHTPFPVHGLDKAMGLRPTRFPWLVLGGGVGGFVSAVALAWYTQLVAYPLNISGKPVFSYQAFVPIFFELTVLGAALTCFFALWIVNGLPRFFHPALTHSAFHRATDDAFFIAVEVTDPKYDAKATRALLTGLGAQEIEEVRS